MVIVEQPDTIVVDYLAWDQHGVEVVTFRSPMYGDERDKIVRLFTVNAVLPAFQHTRQAALAQPHRSQFNYTSAEQRDRERSSWRTLPHTAAAVANSSPKLPDAVPSFHYPYLTHLFAQQWYERHGEVPMGYLSPSALPPPPPRSAINSIAGQETAGP